MKSNFGFLLASSVHQESLTLSPRQFIQDKFKEDFREFFEQFVILSFNLLPKQKELKYLLHLPKVLGKMRSPYYFADFILKALDDPQCPLEKKILCLNLLIILIGKYSFQFENYYQKLFLLLKTEYLSEMEGGAHDQQKLHSAKPILSLASGKRGLFSNKFSAKFMKILEVSFRSTELSFSVLASFVKVSLTRFC